MKCKKCGKESKFNYCTKHDKNQKKLPNELIDYATIKKVL